MRVFWGCVAVLVAIGLWILVDAGDRGRAIEETNDLGNARPSVRASIDAGAGGAEEGAVAAPRHGEAGEPLADASSSPAERRVATDASPISARDPAADSTRDPARDPTPDPATVAATPPLPGLDLFGTGGGGVIPAAAPRVLRTDDRRPSDIVRRIDERTLELDGRFRLTGNGSDADPYVITWEMLTSASEYIDPAQNARTPPPWIRLLDGTFVRISGYYSTAVRVALAKNLLLTLNRWDGCCIGVPPTAFDAIDITMRDPLPMRGLHLTRFGSFKGLFRAECLDAAGFLIGLYRLEDASFETK